jgi:hypothetical protein
MNKETKQPKWGQKYYPAIFVTLVFFLYYEIVDVFSISILRKKHGIAYPHISGTPVFSRSIGVQAVQVEQTGIFLASLWLFCFFVHAEAGAIIGAVWVLLRIGYSISERSHHSPLSIAKYTLPSYLCIFILLFGVIYRFVADSTGSELAGILVTVGGLVSCFFFNVLNLKLIDRLPSPEDDSTSSNAENYSWFVLLEHLITFWWLYSSWFSSYFPIIYGK